MLDKLTIWVTLMIASCLSVCRMGLVMDPVCYSSSYNMVDGNKYGIILRRRLNCAIIPYVVENPCKTFTNKRVAGEGLSVAINPDPMANAWRSTHHDITYGDTAVSNGRSTMCYVFPVIVLALLFVMSLMMVYYKMKFRVLEVHKINLEHEKEYMEKNLQMKEELEKQISLRMKYEQEISELRSQIEAKDSIEKEESSKLTASRLINDNMLTAKQSMATLVNEESQMDVLVAEFQANNRDYFNKLEEYSNNKLTVQDLKYCACFCMKLTPKEISNMYNVESKSVRMSKYRIKQKLNVPSDISLEAFLQQL